MNVLSPTAHEQINNSSSLVHDNVIDGSVKLPTAHEQCFSFQPYIDLHERVRASGLPNYKQCRLPVPSRLCVTVWRDYLQDYFDNIVCEFLEFGWPVNYKNTSGPVSDYRTHRGALQFTAAVDSYLEQS